MNRGFAICPQPLSRLAATAPRPGSLLAFCNHHPKAVLVYGGFEPSAPGGRCSEGRIPRTRWRLLVRFTNLYINNSGDASRPLIFTIYYAHPPQGGSHIVQAIFHCALAQFHPFARTDFTAGVSPLPHPSCLDHEAGAVVLLGAGGKGEHLVGLADGYGIRYVGTGRCAGIGRHVRHVAF